VFVPTGSGGGGGGGGGLIVSQCPPGKTGSQCENACKKAVGKGGCSPADIIKASSTVSKVVNGAAGATLTLPTGQSLELPPGAFVGQRTISVTLYDSAPDVSQTTLTPNGPMIELSPDGLQLSAKATLTLKYAKAFDASRQMVVHTLNSDQLWDAVETTKMDQAKNLVSAAIPHFSLYSTFEVSDGANASGAETAAWVIAVATVVPTVVCGLGLALLSILYLRRKRGAQDKDRDGKPSTAHARPGRMISNLTSQCFEPFTCETVMTRVGTPSDRPTSPNHASNTGKKGMFAFGKYSGKAAYTATVPLALQQHVC
jgi:hypothetical protein